MRDSISLISYAGCLSLSPVYFSKNSLYVRVATSFKVIDIGTPGKLVSSSCYDTQQVCVYLQPFSR